MNPSLQPRTGTSGILIQHIGVETLIYDEHRHLAFCLDRIASSVWRQCDGAQQVSQIVSGAALELGHPVTYETVLSARGQFEKEQLLEGEPPRDAASSFEAMSVYRVDP